jgi:hypothetical protein
MRVLLKTKKTGRYYRGANQFAAEPGEALSFVSVPAAAQFALAERLLEAEIVLRWDHLAQEIPLPVLPEWCDLGEDHRLRAITPSWPSPPSSLSPSAPA